MGIHSLDEYECTFTVSSDTVEASQRISYIFWIQAEKIREYARGGDGLRESAGFKKEPA